MFTEFWNSTTETDKLIIAGALASLVLGGIKRWWPAFNLTEGTVKFATALILSAISAAVTSALAGKMVDIQGILVAFASAITLYQTYSQVLARPTARVAAEANASTSGEA